jgi:hypothetical protein
MKIIFGDLIRFSNGSCYVDVELVYDRALPLQYECPFPFLLCYKYRLILEIITSKNFTLGGKSLGASKEAPTFLSTLSSAICDSTHKKMLHGT